MEADCVAKLILDNATKEILSELYSAVPAQ